MFLLSNRRTFSLAQRMYSCLQEFIDDEQHLENGKATGVFILLQNAIQQLQFRFICRLLWSLVSSSIVSNVAIHWLRNQCG